MVFDNQKIVTNISIRRYLIIIAYFISIIILLVSDLVKNQIFGIDKSSYVVAITILYVMYILFVYTLNYNFFSYNDDGSKLIFRFVSLRAFDNKKRAIEINKKDFAGYKIKISFFNLRQDLVVKIKTKKGIANYPPISLTALSLKHKKMLKNSLNQMI
ncbi:MAG: hypothetical protein PF485_15585 [Bacteroidales bacterium]|jgi:hypothetical protein|nr:hypothetical protein [Bacteroidales bacterium]